MTSLAFWLASSINLSKTRRSSLRQIVFRCLDISLRFSTSITAQDTALQALNQLAILQSYTPTPTLKRRHSENGLWPRNKWLSAVSRIFRRNFPPSNKNWKTFIHDGKMLLADSPKPFKNKTAYTFSALPWIVVSKTWNPISHFLLTTWKRARMTSNGLMHHGTTCISSWKDLPPVMQRIYL